jgi:hypothetical protein
MLLLRPTILAAVFGRRQAHPSPGCAARVDPLAFGKRLDEPAEQPESAASGSLGADLRLFALTFAAGFLVVSVLIA